MKFTLGDAVWLRQTEEEGTLTAVLSTTIYEVEVEGVRFPVFADQLEHPYLRRFRKTGVLRREPASLPLPAPEKKKAPRLPQGCYLSFLPLYREEAGAEEIEAVKVHLVNELPDTVRFEYDLRSSERRSLFALSGIIPEYSNLYIHTISWELMAAQPRFGWRLQPTCEGRVGPQQEGVVSLRAKQLIKRLAALEESGNPAFSEMLVDHFVEAAPLPLPQLKGRASIDQMPIVKPFSGVIDLHAGALLPDAEDYLPAEIFRIQLDALRHFMQEVIANGASPVLIVHGVGNGLLRRAVSDIVKTYPPVRRLVQEWHPRYGFGATGVQLKY